MAYSIPFTCGYCNGYCQRKGRHGAMQFNPAQGVQRSPPQRQTSAGSPEGDPAFGRQACGLPAVIATLYAMSTRKLRQKHGAVYFATFSCHEWVPLFFELQAYDLVYNWMRIAHEMGYHFFGYAIMPNHAHFVIRVPEVVPSIPY